MLLEMELLGGLEYLGLVGDEAVTLPDGWGLLAAVPVPDGLGLVAGWTKLPCQLHDMASPWVESIGT